MKTQALCFALYYIVMGTVLWRDVGSVSGEGCCACECDRHCLQAMTLVSLFKSPHCNVYRLREPLNTL